MTDTTTTDLQNPVRRNLLLAAGAGATALGVASFGPRWAQAQPTSEWDKVFPQSDQVDHEKVSFTNRYGITLVGDLYMPRNRGDAQLPALAVSGPFGAVKEQSSGLYAQTMAERGFVTLASDPSYTGESGGKPRNVASPDINTEDFSAAVDYLGLQSRRPQPHRRHRDMWLQRHGADGRHERFTYQSCRHGFHV